MPNDLHGLEVQPPAAFLSGVPPPASPTSPREPANATGMFIDRGRLYYTVRNRSPALLPVLLAREPGGRGEPVRRLDLLRRELGAGVGDDARRRPALPGLDHRQPLTHRVRQRRGQRCRLRRRGPGGRRLYVEHPGDVPVRAGGRRGHRATVRPRPAIRFQHLTDLDRPVVGCLDGQRQHPAHVSHLPGRRGVPRRHRHELIVDDGLVHRHGARRRKHAHLPDRCP